MCKNMGLDAIVYCNCYRQGRIVSPSPYPHLTFINGNGEVQFKTLSKSRRIRDKQQTRFWKWKATACQHPEMEYHERIANWAGYSLFLSALEQVGWDQFPTLHEELPQANGGEMSASAARVVLQELAIFKQRYQGRMTVLIHVETGKDIMQSVPSWAGSFIWTPFCEIGFDSQGLFIRTRDEPPRECFRSIHPEQRPWDPKNISAPTSEIIEPTGSVVLTHVKTGEQSVSRIGSQQHRFIYTDLATGRQCICPKAVIDTQEPCTFQIEEREETAEDYQYILEPLTRIFQAAIETGNPVCWC
jgi:hypothetical protein